MFYDLFWAFLHLLHKTVQTGNSEESEGNEMQEMVRGQLRLAPADEHPGEAAHMHEGLSREPFVHQQRRSSALLFCT